MDARIAPMMHLVVMDVRRARTAQHDARLGVPLDVVLKHFGHAALIDE